MGGRKKGKWQLTRLFNESIHVKDIDALRDATKVGETIVFTHMMTQSNVSASAHGAEKPVIITGKIKAKFPHVFLFEDGRTFSWKDYLLGLINHS